MFLVFCTRANYMINCPVSTLLLLDFSHYDRYKRGGVVIVDIIIQSGSITKPHLGPLARGSSTSS